LENLRRTDLFPNLGVKGFVAHISSTFAQNLNYVSLINKLEINSVQRMHGTSYSVNNWVY